MKSHWRFAVVAFLLAGAAILLQARNRTENVPPHPPLSSFPYQLGEWTGTDVTIPQDVVSVLGAGDFLLRIYQNSSSPQPSVDLFMAYFPSQRTGDTIHSPRNCLPGTGWSPVESRRISLAWPGHASFPANRYVVAQGDDQRLVIYWYWAHDRGVASEYWAKLYLVADAILLNRSDGSMVRLTTPLLHGEAIESAQRRLLSLAGNVTPLLNQFVPR